MIKNPSAPGASTMVVLCKDVTMETFNPKYSSVYKYEMLGGMHSLLAKTQLTEEQPENPYYKTALADVYVALSDEQSLRLAQRHNQNSHFEHKITHRDLVSSFYITYACSKHICIYVYKGHRHTDLGSTCTHAHICTCTHVHMQTHTHILVHTHA